MNDERCTLNSFLKQDLMTNGLFSNLIEKYVLEESEIVVEKQDLLGIYKILFSGAYDKTFGKFAEHIYEEMESKSNITENKLTRGLSGYITEKRNEDSIKYFEKNVVLLHDGMYGSGFGTFNYVYRAKGFRVFLHSDGKITYNNVYVTIDESGFMYSGDYLLGEIDLKDNCEDIDFGLDFNLHNIITLLKSLLHIKEHFFRDYILEYVTIPPDVYQKSIFSKILENELWDILLDYGANLLKNDSKQITYFEKICNLYMELEISPTPNQVMKFFTTVYSSNSEVMKILVDTLKNQTFADSGLFDTVFKSCLALQSNAGTILEKKENYYNTYLAQLIEARAPNYSVKDQTLRGKSSTGISQGEVDIYIEKNGYPKSIIEGIVLSSVNKENIKSHINKIWKYDTSGNEENFIVVYYTGMNFSRFKERYITYISEEEFSYSLIDIKKIDENKYTEIIVFDTSWSLSGEPSSIKHILINLKI